MNVIPDEVMREIESQAKYFYKSIGDIPMNVAYRNGARFGYQLAQKQPPTASGKEFWIEQRGHNIVGGPHITRIQHYTDSKMLLVREVTPCDRAREDAINGLVEAIRFFAHEVEFNTHQEKDVALESLAAWEKVKDK